MAQRQSKTRRRRSAPFCDSPDQYRLALDTRSAQLPRRACDSGDHKTDVFFAIRAEPDGTAIRTVAVGSMLKRQFDLQGKLRPASLLHVSLYGVGRYGDMPSGFIQATIARASLIENLAPFALSFDRAMSFKNNDKPPVVLCCGEGIHAVMGLRRALGNAFEEDEAVTASRVSFTPHVTLLYDRKMIPETALDEPLHWAVRKVWLVHSLVGRGRYQALADWTLHGSDGG